MGACAILSAAGLVLAVTAQAQTWPARPLRLIVISSPGGASDIMARMLGEQMTASLGQAVIIDNRPSAGGIVGTDLAAKAPGDGYTLLLGSPAAFAIAPHLNPKLPYDPVRDFAPVGQFASLAFALVAHPGLAAQTVGELLALAKSRPGTINFASAGNATTTHLVGELFKSVTGADIVHVPFKGAAPAMTALAGGQVQILFDALVTAVPQIGSGRVRALAMTGCSRSPLLPAVPTMAEAGVGAFVVGSWFGVFVPARTPPAVIARLNAEITKAGQSREVRERLGKLGAETAVGSSEAFGQFVREESDRFGRLIRSAKIRID
jgi:tripartite-type tricarboxylate transporter receptor subunit TctC